MKISFLMFILLLLAFGLGIRARAAERFGAEISALYLEQGHGKYSLTALPAMNGRIFQGSNFSMALQVGGSALKDSNQSKEFAIGVVRVLGGYRCTDSKFLFEALAGAQFWDARGTRSEFGARAAYDVQEMTKSWIDDVFVGLSWIGGPNSAGGISLGLRSWF